MNTESVIVPNAVSTVLVAFAGERNTAHAGKRVTVALSGICSPKQKAQQLLFAPRTKHRLDLRHMIEACRRLAASNGGRKWGDYLAGLRVCLESAYL